MAWEPLPRVKPDIPIRREKFIDIDVIGITALGGTIGNLNITNNITLTDSGVIRTAASGLRVEITATDNDRIKLITADSFEASGGTLRATTIGTDGTTRQLITSLFAPVTTGDSSGTFISLRSESEDDSSEPPAIIVGYDGGSSQTPEFTVTDGMVIRLVDGTESIPSLTIDSASTNGLFAPSTSTLAFTIAGSEAWRISATRVDFDIGTLAFIRIPVKTDTGDPSSPANGDMYVNTQDNTVRVFADSAWRDLATW